jgi:hypothetical protein
VDVEAMALRMELAVKGGSGIEETNDRLEVGLHGLKTSIVAFVS